MLQRILIAISTGLGLCSIVVGKYQGLSYDHYDQGRRILNGDVADVYELSFVVSVETIGGACTGSIVSSQWIITAGHCLIGTTCIGKEIHPAAWPKSQIVRAVTCVIHPHYSADNLGVDLGLVQVDGVFRNDANSQIIPLLPPDTVIFPGTRAVVAGYGQNEQEIYTKILMRAEMYVEAWDDCDKAYKDRLCKHQPPGCIAESLPENVFCVRGQGSLPAGTCYGDSGGPVVINGHLAGVAQFILDDEEKCVTGPPSYFARVDSHLAWIYAHVGL